MFVCRRGLALRSEAEADGADADQIRVVDAPTTRLLKRNDQFTHPIPSCDLDAAPSEPMQRLAAPRRAVERKPMGDFRKAWKTACKKAKLTGTIVHDLRRTAVWDMESPLGWS